MNGYRVRGVLQRHAPDGLTAPTTNIAFGSESWGRSARPSSRIELCGGLAGFGGAAVIPLTDCVSSNSHPALLDGNTFMVHYMGYPDSFRMLAMSRDEQVIKAVSTR
jgi:hypothetical protein